MRVWKQLLLGQLSSRERTTSTIILSGLMLLSCFSPTPSLFVVFLLPLLLAGSWSVLLGLSLLGSIPVYRHFLGFLPAAIFFLLCVSFYRRQIQKERALSQTRQELLKTLVHELRNPLFAAKGTIDLLSSRIDDIPREELGEQLHIATEAMQSINQEIHDLTQFLRCESGKLKARIALTELSTIYRGLQRRFPKERLGEHELCFQGEEQIFSCDGLLLVQALDKLISNALKYSDPCTIEVTCERQRGRFVLEVRDSGPGIPESEQPHIFERFRQIDPTSVGFGLGLFLAREYLSIQEGTLTLTESSATGCCFQITFEEDSHD